MFVWSKKLIVAAGVVLGAVGVFDSWRAGQRQWAKIHTTWWMALNYIGLMVWVFVWMIDQTRMRVKTYGSGSCRSLWHPCRP